MQRKINKKQEKKENKTKKSEIRFLDNCILINNEILVMGDFHLGYEEYIAEKCVFPRIQLKEIFERLEGIFLLLKKENVVLKKIIILGDLKHEFGKISDLEWKEGIKLLDYLDNKVSSKNKTKGIVLIKGNHDNILGPIAKKRDIILKNYYKIDKICFMHGHKLWDACLEDVDRLIIGHLHPSVTLKDNYKKEKFRCFLRGKWKKKQVYILPGFSPISSGYDLRRLKYLHNLDDKKGFLIIGNDKLKKFEVIIYNKKEDKIHNFGKLMRFI